MGRSGHLLFPEVIREGVQKRERRAGAIRYSPSTELVRALLVG